VAVLTNSARLLGSCPVEEQVSSLKSERQRQAAAENRDEVSVVTCTDCGTRIPLIVHHTDL